MTTPGKVPGSVKVKPDVCDSCGVAVSPSELFTVVHRVNGKTIVKTERFHKERCCPYAFWGPKPAGVINDIWTQPPITK